MLKLKIKRALKSTAVFVCSAALLINGSLVCAAPSSEELEQETSDLQNEVNNLNSELDSLSSQLESTSVKIGKKSAEIEKSKLDLSAAKLNEANQYAAMKERIQFMYEGGNISLLEVLLDSEDMSDFLNKAEYISLISDYDRNMLEELQDVRKNVETKQDKLTQQQKELSALAENLDRQQDSLTTRLDSASGNLEDYRAKLDLAKAAEAAAEEAQKTEESGSLDSSVSESDTKKTESKKDTSDKDSDSEKEDSSDKDSDSEKEDSDNNSSDKEDSAPADTSTVALLAAILECEAGSSYDGMLAVGTVIMNRVDSPRFPNSISGVIYQKGQFSPVSSGKLDRVLKRGPIDSAYRAAKAILAGTRHSKVKDCLFFNASYTGKPGIHVGGNVFW